MSEPPSKQSKDDIAREQLVPLREGERPPVVTICAALALAIGIANLVAVAFLIADGDPSPAVGAAAFGVAMLFVAHALWQRVYWALLAFQALLVIVVLFTSLRLVLANDAIEALLHVALLAAAGTLFWFMVKAMARIQMPR